MPGNLYYTLLNVKIRKKNQNIIVLNLKSTGVFSLYLLHSPDAPPKRKKTKKPRPIRIKNWTAQDSWSRISMRGEGESQLSLQNLEKRKVAKINSVLRFELISMLKVYYINPLDIFGPLIIQRYFK